MPYCTQNLIRVIVIFVFTVLILSLSYIFSRNHVGFMGEIIGNIALISEVN